MCGCGGNESVGASGLPTTSLVCRFCQRPGCCGPQPGAAGSGAGTNYPGLAVTTLDISTVNESLQGSLQGAVSALGGLGTSSTGEAAVEQIHVLPAGEGVLRSTANVGGDGTSCSVAFGGSVSQLPVQGGLEVRVDMEQGVVEVELQVVQPAAVTQVFRYRLQGLRSIEGASGFAVSNLVEEPVGNDLAGTAAAGIGTMGIGFWCALKCGGVSILGTLVACLPAFFAGGPAGFIACVVGKLGGTAAGVAVCIAQKCLS